MAAFKDYFSKVSRQYARYRPSYPRQLFHYLASLCPSRQIAWDCGTGSGQAATGLSRFFEHVIASDASAAQIGSARSHPRISYRVMRAERTDLESASLDLITVGQALHWFDIEGFFSEARRVLKPGGVLAVWAYGLILSKDKMHQVILDFHRRIIADFWPPERALIEDGYENIPFPFEEVETPDFSMTANWTVDQLKGYLDTWSASQRYKQRHGHSPVDLIAEQLLELAPPSKKIGVVWPMKMRVGRKDE